MRPISCASASDGSAPKALTTGRHHRQGVRRRQRHHRLPCRRRRRDRATSSSSTPATPRRLTVFADQYRAWPKPLAWEHFAVPDHRRHRRDRRVDHAPGRLRRDGERIRCCSTSTAARTRSTARRSSTRPRCRRRPASSCVMSNPRGGTGRDAVVGPVDHGPQAPAPPGHAAGAASTSTTCSPCSTTALDRYPFCDPRPRRACSAAATAATWPRGWPAVTATASRRSAASGPSTTCCTEEFTSDIATVVPGRARPEPRSTIPRSTLRMSPIRFVRDINVPMLILHSEEDYRCPISQAEELFIALRLLGKDVTFYRFPGESHELSRSGSPVHRRQRAEIILDFFADQLEAPLTPPSPSDELLGEPGVDQLAGDRDRRAGSAACRRGGTSWRRRSPSDRSTISPAAVLGAEADHQAVRERPRLAAPVAHVADRRCRPLRAPRGRPHPRATRRARRTRPGTVHRAVPELHAAGQQRLLVASCVTSVIIAGARRGNASSPHAGQRIARSPGDGSVGVPQRPQKRWVRAHSTSCTARPATSHSTSPARP